ncbi:thiosulfate sulfurtransferase 18-like [Cucurbita maxima]|uniref:Thiosulfate sulfurtransferase 18-like n=1 Tax=Cucurbita maxima TaxID=3661 RepID=A0A6J1IMX5_CUCMA|nr:thiosulfate sulfurtransferase 18-like [Cucurbita maxima]
MSSLDSSSAGVVTVNVLTAKKLLDSGYGFLDVRTVEEFQKGHVAAEKIVNIPYFFSSPNGRVKNDRFLEEVSAVFKKDDYFIVGCGGGGRSLVAAGELVNIGFKNVKDMGGGFQAWVANGLPVSYPKA